MTSPEEFDLRPDPRILPMLGEISLPQWRCIAELIDNAVDGFLSNARAGEPTPQPEVMVNLPLRDDAGARVTVSDNGPGMAPDRLERAVRAGWSGNSPVDSLGMFGMGFNIATARLGTVTTVWTSRMGDAEEHGLRVDFDELRKQGHFRTPRLTRPKTDPSRSGTTVTIESLKPEQRAWFVRATSRSSIKRELSLAYSAMLRGGGVPISFSLVLNSKRVPALHHCVWGEDRSVETTRHGTVFAIQRIDRQLPDRPFCTACWQWLAAGDACPVCGSTVNVVQRKRHVHGWIGLQRHLSTRDYGLDFIRNGRKIEIGNRDLFSWSDPVTGETELEYPIDDVRQRGRFVGEIHLDHCRVTYMKDRFERTDVAWDEMVGIVRGVGPLQPQKASQRGYGVNESPLFTLYQAFRRNSPPNARVAGVWANVLVVKDNERAEEMAKLFREGVPEYQTDEKWWELVVEEDQKLLTPGGAAGGATPGVPGATGPTGTPTGGLPGFTAEGGGVTPTPAAGGSISVPPPPKRTPVASLSREYRHPDTSLKWDVKAYEVEATDPELNGGKWPWVLRRKAADGTSEFFVNAAHEVFRSATMTPLDALLCELAHKWADFLRGQPQAPEFAVILADLREQYGASLKLDSVALLNSVEALFRDIARAWSAPVETSEASRLFLELPGGDQQAIHHRMASRLIPNPQEVISSARFLEFAPAKTIVAFVTEHPDLFFDGKCWEDTYADLDYLDPAATAQARRAVLQRYEALLADAVWLSEQEAPDLELATREQVLRAMLAVALLQPSVAEG